MKLIFRDCKNFEVQMSRSSSLGSNLEIAPHEGESKKKPNILGTCKGSRIFSSCKLKLQCLTPFIEGLHITCITLPNLWKCVMNIVMYRWRWWKLHCLENMQDVWILTFNEPIQNAFTYSFGPSSVVRSDLGPAPLFPPMRVLQIQRSQVLGLVYEGALILY